MLDKLMKVNIKQFDEGEEDFSKYISEGGDLDIDSLVEDYQEDETETTEEETSEETEEEETSEEEEETSEESEEETSEEEESEEEGKKKEENPEVEGKEKQTADQAFANMRKKLEQNEPLAKWVQDLATKQGFKDPQELINAFEQKQIAKEAQEKGVPVEMYERLNKLEKEASSKDEALFAQQFEKQIEDTKSKYELKDEQITDVFRYMGENGYIDENGRTTVPFEDAYVLSNKENLIKDAQEKGRQEYLEKQRKKQKGATPTPGTNAEDSKKKGNDLDYSKDGVFKTLEDMGIPID